jgi:N-acetylneuraminate synthase
MFKAITIKGPAIGADFAPCVIAEMSTHYNGNIETAFKIIEAGKQAGADVVKFQTYRPNTIALNYDSEDFRIHGGMWGGPASYNPLKNESSRPSMKTGHVMVDVRISLAANTNRYER